MEFNNNNGNGNEMWDWQGEDYCLQKHTNLDISQCLWNGVSQDSEHLSYVFDDTTPVKDCGDFAYQIEETVIMKKDSQHRGEMTSQLKRRRMLQFDNEVLDNPLYNKQMSSLFSESKEEEDSLKDAMSDMSQWVSGFTDDKSTSGYEELDESSDWLADCFNDAELHCSPDDMNLSGESDVQIDISEFCETPSVCEATVVQKRPIRTRQNAVFEGKKSYIRTPTKLASSVVYPFAFIKPCGAHGAVTLKDINQRIRTPPPSKVKQSSEDPSPSYPTSAFTGKPVVGKTKIHTEGGKGSITIMRTKG